MRRSPLAVSIFAIALLMFVSAPRAEGTTIYGATLAGSFVVLPTVSPGSGSALLTLNGDSLTIDLSFSGLLAPAGQLHIHCCPPVGVNAPLALVLPGFPMATSGTYSRVLDLLDPTTYTLGFRNNVGGGTAAGAEAALLAAFNSGNAYFDINNSMFQAGEVRGQIGLVPEPATLTLVGLGALGLRARRRRR